MSDLISREAAIEYFMINTNWHDEEGYSIDDWDEKRKLLEDYFNGVPSAEPEWIPVTERMPEIKEHHVSDVCLVCARDHGMMFAELQENIFGQVGWDVEREDDYHEPMEVVAWMPLPKPYEENHEQQGSD